MMKLIPPARRLSQQRLLQMSHTLQSWEREIRVEISLKILFFNIMQLVLRYFEEAIRKIKIHLQLKYPLGIEVPKSVQSRAPNHTSSKYTANVFN